MKLSGFMSLVPWYCFQEYLKCVFNMIGPRYVKDRYANVKYKTAAWHAEVLQ